MPPPSRQALWSAGTDETVEVNQRALIDKILARYSGEYTIFRELLQNADDAGAQHVQVKFYSKAGSDALDAGASPSRLPNAKEPMSRYVVTNDGIPFRTEDWARLKKIAEGNPDEEKIGAFGVGFYSLWSVCDDPFVESGSKWMGFYWKDGKDQLLARSGDLPPGTAQAKDATMTGHPWTKFTMALREPTVIESPLDFARFLVTSLTFMRTIKRIDMVVDDINVLEVRKDVTGRQSVSRSGLNNTSSMGMMKVNGVDATSMVITTRVMKWLSATAVTAPPLPPASSKPKSGGGLFSAFFGRSHAPPPVPETPRVVTPPQDPMEIDVLGREIQIYQADVKVSISSSFAKELERATKKAPPSRMPASLVFSRQDEMEHMVDTTEKKASAVFAGLCPPLDSDKSAKVFIGQPTSQTTGIGGHLSARFIPTVERESIDLVDRHVAHWNKELLWVGGYLSRLIYELELVDLQHKWSKTSVADKAIRDQILARGLHALRFFSFRPTTPSAAVGSEMESAFYQCGRNNATLPLASVTGIRPVKEVRLPNSDLQAFLPDLPVVTPAIVSDAPRAVNRLRERGLLTEIAFEDVIKQLGERPLTEPEMIGCLKWWQSVASMDGYTPAIRNRLLDAAILVTDGSKIVPLGTVKTYMNPQSSSIPTDMPLPPHTVPYTVTKELKGQLIHSVFGWTELSLAHYITFLAQPPMSGWDKGANPDTDMTVSAVFAERVLGMLARGWGSISTNQHAAIKAELSNVACIPTKMGFKKPGEAYFEKVLLFDDLPTIQLPKTTSIKGGMEKMLLGIGVRRTVDLQLVFSRLIGGGSWTCVDLMKYLVSVKDTLTPDEKARLRQTAAFPLEQAPEKGEEDRAVVRLKPHQLYEPSDAMRALDLPLLDWGDHKWKSNSDEAKMLYELGLRRFPPPDTLLSIAAGAAPRNEQALTYLLSHMHTQYQGLDVSAFGAVPFIPATSAKGEHILAAPGEVFTNQQAKVLGFAVARGPAALPENAVKLRIPTDPSMEQLVASFLANPVSDIDKARIIFEYLGTRVGSSAVSSLTPLQSRQFIPVPALKSEKGGLTRLAPSDEVYFASANKADSIYASAFTFIDFGPRANIFLKLCGVKDEPSHKDIARLLLRNPESMLRQAGSHQKYLQQLRILAANISTFDSALIREMIATPFVLGSQRVAKDKGASEEDFSREWRLCKASDTVVADDPTASRHFDKHILIAPEEQLLEQFYSQLGAPLLSKKVKTERVALGPRQGTSSTAIQTRQHILERLTIFLANTRSKPDYKIDWLAREGNFVVAEAQDIKARYTFEHGRSRLQHVETLSAMASKSRLGAITLTLSVSTPTDQWEVSDALCEVLFKNRKAEDALVLDNILTYPLQTLKKRGYNVERILNQQKEERLRFEAEQAKAREAREAEQALTTKAQAAAAKVSRASTSDAPPAYGEKAQSIASANEGNSLMGSLRKKFDDIRMNSPMPGGFPGMMPGGLPSGNGTGANEKFQHASKGGQEKSTARPTDVDRIRDLAHDAVNASRPQQGSEIRDPKRNINDVAEPQGHYCDDSAEANLRLILDPGPNGCKVWIPHDAAGFEHDDQPAISAMFASQVLIPLGRVFKLYPSVINVFWDREGPLIAFNRNGALFCNARYFAAWHADKVQAGNLGDAYISWYFTLAHELAHNLESAHNASHEFYFSSISEEYLVDFVKLLQSSTRLLD